MNFIYTVDPNAEEPLMLINKHIGFDEQDGMGIMGDQFQMELLTLDSLNKRLVNVWINCEGGSVMEGQKIYSAIMNSKCKVDTYNMGIAASIAAVIFQAGRTRYMADYARLMYHNPYGGSDRKTLDELRGSIAKMISGRVGKSDAEVLDIMNRTTWINGEDAKASGFCDEIKLTEEANRGRLRKVSNDLFYKESSEVFNKQVQEKSQLKIFNHKPTMNKVTNKLSLVEGANEEQILNAIELLEVNAREAVEAKNSLVAELETAKAQAEEAATKYESLKADFDKIENEKKVQEEINVKNSAEAMVKTFVNKIGDKAEAIEKWVNLAVKDMEGTKTILEDLPLNKVAPKEKDKGEATAPYNMAARLLEIQNKNSKS